MERKGEHVWFLFPSRLLHSSYPGYRLLEGSYDLQEAYVTTSGQQTEQTEPHASINHLIRAEFTPQLIQEYSRRHKELETRLPESVLGKRKTIENANQHIDFIGACSMLAQMTKRYPSLAGSHDESIELQSGSFEVDELINKVIENPNETLLLLMVGGQQFLIPAQTTFLLSDFSSLQNLRSLAKRRGGYQLISMDPPWENKSAERKADYQTFYMKRLYQLPLGSLVHTTSSEDPEEKKKCFSLVAIWVTNNPKIIKFLREDLLPRWNLQILTRWHWLKCTSDGQIVCPLDSSHRKPYETVFICGSNEQPINLDQPSLKERVIVSTPSIFQHSRKPPIHGMLEDLYHDLSDNPVTSRLELFARNLEEGWTSWGNEVLRHQSTAYFTEEQPSQQRLDPPNKT